ncbi:MAG: hypothetical protein U0998_12870 [Moraxellaceae bacterium]|nr:hypothetical protein [Moraxellaceae bacterium]MDP1776686.1 hypothetical protein [Moraxellaceae bacterium]MDZ4298583.1 hypothetical protein [Moraxellaceae bacterium]MDZ4388061.1 hypothetical protein [Moraxellaceae bacterium]
MLIDLLGTWSGLLSLLVIILSAVAIPFGVYLALARQYKGPIELANDRTEGKVLMDNKKHSEWHRRRYAH